MASAVYRTLALPEIIMTIASFLEDDLPALVSCLHVNRLWSEAATLYLWSTCGDGLGDAIPHIHHLTSLASTPERMNRYASCVKELAFSVAEAGDDLDSALETQKAYHDILANAAFPRLEKVNFGDFDYESVYYSTSSLLLQYVRPKLRTFSAFVSPPNQGEYVSDGFLASMKSRCRHLKNLELSLDPKADIKGDAMTTAKGLASFLDSMQSLECLGLRGGFEDSLSSKGFAHLARHPSLTYLDLPHVAEEWVQSLGTHPKGTLFRKLETFRAGLYVEAPNAGVSDTTLGLLMPHLQGIKEFRVRSSPSSDSHETFHVAVHSIPSTLQKLELIHNSEGVVRGSDLVALAKYAPGLQELKMPFLITTLDEEWDTLDAQGITDAVFKSMASYLPHLEVLDLASANSTATDTIMAIDGYQLTQASLWWLGIHCRHLRSCSLIAAVPFGDFLRAAPPELFPELEHLNIHQGQDEDDFEPYTDVDKLASKTLEVAPALARLTIHSMHDTDVALLLAVREQIGDEWSGPELDTEE